MASIFQNLFRGGGESRAGSQAAAEQEGDGDAVLRSTSGVLAGAAQRVRKHSVADVEDSDDETLQSLDKQEIIERLRRAELARDTAVVSDSAPLTCCTALCPAPSRACRCLLWSPHATAVRRRK